MSNARNFSLILLTLAAASCGDDEGPVCIVAPQTGCENGLVCEEVAGQPACAAPLVVRGRVTNAANAPIADAIVTALDANDAPAAGSVRSDATGAYELRVPTPRAAGGQPAQMAIKLRASAAGFETFPSGLRRSFPIELSTATAANGQLVLQTSATDIVLQPVANAAGLGVITGTVRGPAGRSGALVVAEGMQLLTAVSDVDGAYTIFNVPAGAYTVRGYAAGLQLAPASAMVAMSATTSGVDLLPTMTPLGTVSGTLNFVEGAAGNPTSVVLVVESTFNDVLKRGEVPPGLRAPRTGPVSVNGPFTITDVPDGRYVVLAAFENDRVVRDPSSIGGTQIQRITVGDAGRTVMLAAMFKITVALEVFSPGAGDVPDPVAGNPSLQFATDPSADDYLVEVFDSRGQMIWNRPGIGKVTGKDRVTVPYMGPPLTVGQYYQFRGISFHQGVPISQTEDLRGVFISSP